LASTVMPTSSMGFTRASAPGWRLHLVGGCSPEDRDYAMAVKREALGLPVHSHDARPSAWLGLMYCAREVGMAGNLCAVMSAERGNEQQAARSRGSVEYPDHECSPISASAAGSTNS
jgi:hypothetical protein